MVKGIKERGKKEKGRKEGMKGRRERRRVRVEGGGGSWDRYREREGERMNVLLVFEIFVLNWILVFLLELGLYRWFILFLVVIFKKYDVFGCNVVIVICV